MGSACRLRQRSYAESILGARDSESQAFAAGSSASRSRGFGASAAPARMQRKKQAIRINVVWLDCIICCMSKVRKTCAWGGNIPVRKAISMIPKLLQNAEPAIHAASLPRATVGINTSHLLSVAFCILGGYSGAGKARFIRRSHSQKASVADPITAK